MSERDTSTIIKILEFQVQFKFIISKPAGKPIYDYLYQRDILVILQLFTKNACSVIKT